VTFTDKAASEMVERLRLLGQPAVTARTFHAHALSQLRHFWPAGHDGQAAPAEILESKFPILSPGSPGGCPAATATRRSKDLAGEIEWAKNRRIGPGDLRCAAPLPPVASRPCRSS
jgi:DNA helicase-2/ATP-dependent DNA helicase PcrA